LNVLFGVYRECGHYIDTFWKRTKKQFFGGKGKGLAKKKKTRK
jgi:hypothetical protein